MGRFDGILICTDLDGTLLRNDRTISAENIEAIDYFKREGGYFTFVTGRMPSFVSHIWEAIRPNAPFGCINGGGLYDYEAKRYVYTIEMPRTVIPLIESVDKALADVGIQVNTFEKVYFCRENETMVHFRAVTNLPNLTCPYGEVPEAFAKIVFGCESEDDIRAMERILRAHPMADGFDFIQSEQTLFEILPKGVGKSVAITQLAKILGIDPKRTVALGDYNNDISMLRAAGLGIAVANATPETKAAADFVTVSNEEHAIARVIYDIERGVYAFEA